MSGREQAHGAHVKGKILVVEDDQPLRAMLMQQLELDGYDVHPVGTLGEAFFVVEDERFDLVVLDLNLPDGDGTELAESLSGNDGPPVIMLTARADLDSKLRGLYAGAADYIGKPFSVPELVARIHARLRDRRHDDPAKVYRDVTLDAHTGLLVGPRADHGLRGLEKDLLEILLSSPERVFSRMDLERRLYGPDLPGSNTIEVYVSRIRAALREVGSEVQLHTVRGKGYLVR